MKRALRGRPTPGLVIACLALFLSLGGVSYAVATGSIDSRAIKDGSILNRDFKDGTLRGQEFKRDSLGGGAIKESALATVPNAAAVGGATARRFEAFTLAQGATRALGTVGPFTLTARCRADGATQIADIAVSTSQVNSAFDGATKDTQFNPGETGILVSAQAPAGTPSFDQESAGAAIATDGTEILGQELYAGTNVLGAVNQCRFGGVLWVG